MDSNPAASEAEILRGAGFSVTAQRVQILRLLRNAKDGKRHLNVEDIHRKLRRAGDRVSMGSIYRILGQFEASGLVSRVLFEDSCWLYELADRDEHDHMLRTDTQEIIEFSDAVLARRQKELAAEHGLEIIGHRLVLFVRAKQAS